MLGTFKNVGVCLFLVLKIVFHGFDVFRLPKIVVLLLLWCHFALLFSEQNFRSCFDGNLPCDIRSVIHCFGQIKLQLFSPVILIFQFKEFCMYRIILVKLIKSQFVEVAVGTIVMIGRKIRRFT